MADTFQRTLFGEYMTTLRSKLIRLAYLRPELRKEILPLVRTAAEFPIVRLPPPLVEMLRDLEASAKDLLVNTSRTNDVSRKYQEFLKALRQLAFNKSEEGRVISNLENKFGLTNASFGYRGRFSGPVTETLIESIQRLLAGQ